MVPPDDSTKNGMQAESAFTIDPLSAQRDKHLEGEVGREQTERGGDCALDLADASVPASDTSDVPGERNEDDSCPRVIGDVGKDRE
jgi:hypothetical protein